MGNDKIFSGSSISVHGSSRPSDMGDMAISSTRVGASVSSITLWIREDNGLVHEADAGLPRDVEGITSGW